VHVSPEVGPFALEVLPRDMIGHCLYVYGVWDLRSTRLLQWFLRPEMTVLDVGANIGYFTLLAAHLVGPGGLVRGFEPHDEVRDRLARNVARNGLTNVEISPEAVTSLTGEIPFYVSADASNQGVSSTDEGPARHGERARRPRLVPAVRLDDAAASLGRRIDVVKLDIEDGEEAAILGAEQLLGSADAPPLVLFEAYHLEKTAAVLMGHGFSVRRLVHDSRYGVRLAPGVDAVPGEPNYVAYRECHESALAPLLRAPRYFGR
jgi:FkbM family methyltransferase